MMNNGFVLLKTLLLSTSLWNIFRHSKDKKKRRRVVGNAIGSFIVYVMLVGLCIAMGIGFGRLGLIQAVPTMCALVISLMAFVFTLFKTNGYLFGFKEYDMLMSLPLESRTVAGCKFLYMYVRSLPWYLSLSLAMLISYGVHARPGAAVYPLWLVLSLLLPVIPMLGAAFVGFLIARVSAGHRKNNVLQTVLMMVFVIFCFSLRFIIEGVFRDDRIPEVLQKAFQLGDSAGRYYLPVSWFTAAVTKLSLSDMLLLAGVSILLFGVVFAIVGRSYRRINSALKSHAAARSFRMSAQRQRGAVSAIAYKEFKRMTGSTQYMVNCGVGHILAVLVGLIALVIGPDKIIHTVMQEAPINAAMLRPSIPFIAYFLVGMLATTACSPSLEGKNYWILQSLPIEKRTVFQGKMLFNLALSVPFMTLSILFMCIASKAAALDTALYVLLGLALCGFSTAWGCVCGIRHMRLDWENDIEVIKQGAAVTIYMLPNMVVAIGLMVVSVILGMRVDARLTTLGFTLIALLLAALCYRWVLKLASKR